PEGSVAVLPGVFVASAAAFLSGDGLQAEVDQLRILTGYAGWAPGQLERELKRGGWKVAPARAVDVFDADPESLWNYLSGKGAVLI
ncbi:MAG: YqgE/AlgH family protein, partial [Desulfuromonadales bacterium]|nr:YqgE/AlgH family protein [Desulfuromonadales bacterium]NIS39814.1 YqgE/AlgH family protein [Desulfuromonadales bacterium]